MAITSLSAVRAAAQAVKDDLLASLLMKDLAQAVIDLADTLAEREPTRNLSEPFVESP